MNVLVICEEQHLVETIQTCVALRWPRHAVMVVSSPEQIASALASSLPDLVILDLGLPSSDPLVVLQQVGEQSRIPILVLSEKGDQILPVQALERGADSYLPKPVHHMELLARMLALCRRSQPEKWLGVAGPHGRQIYVDTLQQRVVIEGGEVYLTPKEWGVLAYLWRHEGRVVPKEELLKAVGGTAASQPSTLKKCIASLRVKLGDDSLKPFLIHTHRRRGYSLRRT